ncbi:MAG: hypothetical protein FJ125_16145, partial [Deltaproteobacteria bacterium]|nr:hypothetical protein [Deltaproteobacteria bacterium]
MLPASLASAGSLLYNLPMPELPDIELCLACLRPRVLQQQLTGVRLASPFLLRTEYPPPRRGKLYLTAGGKSVDPLASRWQTAPRAQLTTRRPRAADRHCLDHRTQLGYRGSGTAGHGGLTAMSNASRCAFPLGLLLLLLSSMAQAQDVPERLNHEGLLLDAGGLPLSGAVQLRLAVHDQSSGGNRLYFEDYQLELVDGYYVVSLGTSWLEGSGERWLGISVDGGATELSPRRRLQSVPYALAARSELNAVGDITPRSISLGGQPVIDAQGKWVGPPLATGQVAGYATPGQVLAALLGVDGPDSQLDADTLDGKQAADFLLRADLAQAVRAVEGIDADTLDGKQAASFVPWAELAQAVLAVEGIDADTLDGEQAASFV